MLSQQVTIPRVHLVPPAPRELAVGHGDTEGYFQTPGLSQVPLECARCCLGLVQVRGPSVPTETGGGLACGSLAGHRAPLSESNRLAELPGLPFAPGPAQVPGKVASGSWGNKFLRLALIGRGRGGHRFG